LPEGKNAIYGASFLLAWQQIKETFKNPITINPNDWALTQLDNSQAFIGTLKKGEYKATTRIKGEVITVTAGFNKKLPFTYKLESFKDKLHFNGTPVASFGDVQYTYFLAWTASVPYYKDDNDFVLRLSPADEGHEILLYMTPTKGATMAEMFAAINEKVKQEDTDHKAHVNYWKHGIEGGDEVLVPRLKLNIEEHHKNIENKGFVANGREFTIGEAKQQTIFSLDETGAAVKDMSEIAVAAAEGPVEEDRHPKKLHFNKPFLVMLKRRDSPNPYFAMWVENTELMQK
jgi:hypothetical protein